MLIEPPSRGQRVRLFPKMDWLTPAPETARISVCLRTALKTAYMGVGIKSRSIERSCHASPASACAFVPKSLRTSLSLD